LPGFHCGCSAPPVASAKVMRCWIDSAPVLRSTLMSVANGGVSALLTASSSECSGS